MIAQHAYAVLTRDIPEHGLLAGDVGVVIHIHRKPGADTPDGYMLEMFSLDGVSLDEVSVTADAVRPALETDRLHARTVAAE
ncbi:DUF4926 domain-containing protein [Caulobacter sp. LjRoot300]|uniref:DUF4926 domain-containing protein n=1 Tax=Caulobacter sp. LjRoot300 TaxID=3342321 RepID=UPI003ECED83A